jgi:RNA 2',3'-cyclic 3'-phosphodiesterase
MRAFFAIEVSDDVKKYLTAVVTTAAKHVDGVRWVNEAGRHITLEFLGEIDEEMAGKFKESTAYIGAKYAPFTGTIKEIDAFPDKRRARVLVITLENGVDNITNIYKEIEETCQVLGFEKENRPYTPHVTLGRRKVPGPIPDKALVKLERMSFNVHSVVLFKSTLRPEGALYTPVWDIQLKGEKQAGE